MALSSHAIVAIIELVFYVLLLVPTFINLFHYGIKNGASWLYLALFSLVKATGAAILIYVSQHPTASAGVQVTMQIMYQIALGPLLSATLSILNPKDPNMSKQEQRKRNKTGLPRILRLLHTIIIVAIALGITGATDRIPQADGKPGSDYDQGATFLHVSSILLLVAFLGICFGAIVFVLNRSKLPEPQHTLIIFILAAIPLLFVRVLYSLLGAFTLSSTTEQKPATWNMFTGSVAAYVVMAMLTQIGVVLLYTVGGFKSRDRMRREEWGVERKLARQERGVHAGRV